MERCSKINVTNGKSCSRYAVTGGCCKQHAQLAGLTAPVEKVIVVVDGSDTEFLECSSKNHVVSGSTFPRDRVPKSRFEKWGTSEYYKQCIDCRFYHKRSHQRSAEVNKIKTEERRLNSSEFGYCGSGDHLSCGSPYERDQVPIALFRKNPDDPNSVLFDYCYDCRKHIACRRKRDLDKKKLEANAEGKFVCNTCFRIGTLDERPANVDGTTSTKCKSCKAAQKVQVIALRKCFGDILMEFIVRFDVSCQLCECIFLKPSDDGYIIPQLSTYLRDGFRYVNYGSLALLASDFINDFRDRLELRIIQLDHLTEQEQRERGILQPDMPYVPKAGSVSSMLSRDTMRSEAAKCQHLCGRCHVKVTIAREPGSRYNRKSLAIREKLEYVNRLKEKNGGCSICKFWDPTIVRFFQMDHIDPSQKVDNISAMVQSPSYTMEDIVNECNKCRVLCQHCHVIHTSKQKRGGIVR